MLEGNWATGESQDGASLCVTATFLTPNPAGLDMLSVAQGTSVFRWKDRCGVSGLEQVQIVFLVTLQSKSSWLLEGGAKSGVEESETRAKP